MLDPVSAHVKLIERNNVLREVVADIIIRAKLTVDRFVGGEQIAHLNVHILCHDASTKTFLNYTKIGRVSIGDNVFIGAESIVLPGVTIGSNVVIGAGSVVTHDVPGGMLVAGNPARTICSLEDYLQKERLRMGEAPRYGEEYTLRKDVSMELRMKQKAELDGKIGYID